MYFGFDNVSIKYGKREIVNHITMEFPYGEITTIIGQNGCGKSSLLKTISKAVKQKGGTVVLEDKDINTYKPKNLAKRIAYLPQMHDSPQDIDVKTLVSYGRFPHLSVIKKLTERDYDIVNKTMKLTGLEHLKDQKLKTLSGGEKQRAWIAMTICQKPEILILDEPTTYLDIGYQIEVLELVKKMNEELNLTIIMVLHDLNLAARYSHNLYAIKDGKIYQMGKSEEVLSKDCLKDIFGIDAEIINDNHNNCPFFIPLKFYQTSAAI